jgi:SAM-dependent methyltransferase
MEEFFYAEYNRTEKEHWWFQARRLILGALLDRRIDPHPARHILNIGCGTGESSHHLMRWGDVISFDISSTALSFCGQNGSHRLVQGDAMNLPFADGAFDLVCGLDMLEHLADDRAALAEIHRVCRPGGQVLITVPAIQLLWSDHDVLNHHHRRYYRSRLRHLIVGAGLETDLISYFNTLMFAPILMVRLLNRLIRWLRLKQQVTSDFARGSAGPLAAILRNVFAAEGPLLGRIPMPVGVSIVCIARKPDLLGDRVKPCPVYPKETHPRHSCAATIRTA